MFCFCTRVSDDFRISTYESYALLFCKWLILYFSISVLKLKYQLKVLKVSYSTLFGYGNEILRSDK